MKECRKRAGSNKVEPKVKASANEGRGIWIWEIHQMKTAHMLRGGPTSVKDG